MADGKKGVGNDVDKGNGSKSGQTSAIAHPGDPTSMKGDKQLSPPKQETDTHAGGAKTTKFYGDSSGNADRNINLSAPGKGGGAGESHPFSSSSPFLGATKGNKDRPIDISRGEGGGAGGEYIAGRGRKKFTGNP